ncbi:MAG TPA: hypothetical protein VGI40_09670, partial [Pirellulaceae bacterium]
MSSLWRLFANPESQLRLSVAVSVVVLECLIAIWAATSRRHWFWRALAVWGGIMVLAPIRAWEPAWLFGLSSPLIVLFIRGGTWAERRFFMTSSQLAEQVQGTPYRFTRYRFTLSDLLLFMLLVGLWLRGILEIARHWQPSSWLGWLATSISLAVIAVAAYSCTQIPRQWQHAGLLTLGMVEVLVSAWLELPWLGVIAAVAGAVAYGYAFERRHWLAMLLLAMVLPTTVAAMIAAGQWMRWQTIVDDTRWPPFLVLLLAETAVVICVMVVIALVHVASSRESGMRWRIAAAFGVLLVLPWLVLPTGKIYRRMLTLTPPAAPVSRFETPVNHYGEILQLAQRITALDPTPTSGAVVNGNWQQTWRTTPGPPAMQPMLNELMDLLDAPNAVPYDPATDATAACDGHIQAWRTLIRSLQAEAKVTATAQEYDRSARLSLAIVRTADMLSRGGVDFDVSLGCAVRRIGYAELMNVIDRLSKEELQNVLAVLQQSRNGREEISASLARQADFNEQVYGWHNRYEHAASRDYFDWNKQWPRTVEIHNSRSELELTTNVLLEAHTTVRLFQHDRGRLPESLDELVPAYLSSPPADPNLVPFRYRIVGKEIAGKEFESQNFVLYSVGWDGRDDGGKFTTYNRFFGTLPGTKWSSESPGSNQITYD